MAGPWLLLTDRSADRAFISAFELTKDTTTIGRDEVCDIVLMGKHVSRHHASVVKKPTGFVIQDGSSSSGLLVDEKKVSEASLDDGTQVTIACFQLTFATSLPLPTIYQASPSEMADTSTSTTSSGDIERIIETLQQKDSPKELLEQLLLGLVNLLSAQRGFVLLADEETNVFSPVVAYQLKDEEERSAISRTVCRFAVENDTSLVIENSACDERCKGAASLVTQSSPRTIICGPLRSKQGTIGTIYLDKEAEDGTTVTDDHIATFRTITGFAAELLTNDRTRNRLLAAQSRIEALNSISMQQERLILGEGAADDELRQLIKAAAEQDVTVLITGETGTGKEMVAKELHRLSSRNRETFIPVNCAALPAEIIEAELFGAEKGAYTGAVAARMGRFQLAHKGTMFLDEIGELPLDIQVKLLRVLQERTVTPLGGAVPKSVDFQLICATNANLEFMVKDGTFRQDMFYRINVFQIPLPPLRERQEAILPLAQHFLDHFSLRSKKRFEGFTTRAQKALRAHLWPGNIRELRNAIERAVVIEQGKEVTPESLPIGPRAVHQIHPPKEGGNFVASLPENYDDARSAFDEAFFKRLLSDHEGNIRAVARAAGIARNTLYRRLEKAGLVKKE